MKQLFNYKTNSLNIKKNKLVSIRINPRYREALILKGHIIKKTSKTVTINILVNKTTAIYVFLHSYYKNNSFII